MTSNSIIIHENKYASWRQPNKKKNKKKSNTCNHPYYKDGHANPPKLYKK